MRILIVRHGETEQNIQGVLQGHQPGALTERGREQARSLAHRLKGERIHAAYCSDLTRAVDTMRYISEFHPDLPVTYSEEIRERSLGIYEGRHGERYHDDFIRSGAERSKFKPEGGESIVEVQARTDRFLSRIRGRSAEETILVCTHGGVLQTLLATLAAAPIEEMLLHSFRNTSLSAVTITGPSVLMTEFNCVKHLRDVKTENSGE